MSADTSRAATLNELAHATADVAAAVEALRLAHIALDQAHHDLLQAKVYEVKLKRAIDNDD